MKKALAIMICILVFCSIFSGCGSVRNDVPVADISSRVVSAIGMSDDLTEVNESYIKGFMQLDPDKFGEWSVMINAYGTSADEFGVFKAGELDVKSVKAAVDAYLRLRLDTWMDEYMPAEKPKLTGAQVKVSGDYVIYCILSADDAKTAITAFNEALK